MNEPGSLFKTYLRTLKNINRFENLQGIVTSPFSETTGTVSLNTAGRY